MTNFNFHNIELTVDKALTKATYDKAINKGVSGCKCVNCLNFATNIDNVFPAEVLSLFLKLGIDYKKYVEVWHSVSSNKNQHIYEGWFNFKGNFIENEKNDVIQITENFKMWFSHNIMFSFFDNEEDLVQIWFVVNTDWLIDNDCV